MNCGLGSGKGELIVALSGAWFSKGGVEVKGGIAGASVEDCVGGLKSDEVAVENGG